MRGKEDEMEVGGNSKERGKNMKDRKASGMDGIPAEVWKY